MSKQGCDGGCGRKKVVEHFRLLMKMLSSVAAVEAEIALESLETNGWCFIGGETFVEGEDVGPEMLEHLWKATGKLEVEHDTGEQEQSS